MKRCLGLRCAKGHLGDQCSQCQKKSTINGTFLPGYYSLRGACILCPTGGSAFGLSISAVLGGLGMVLLRIYMGFALSSRSYSDFALCPSCSSDACSGARLQRLFCAPAHKAENNQHLSHGGNCSLHCFIECAAGVGPDDRLVAHNLT